MKDGWYVAVTTAPRKECTLKTCLSSLVSAGWEPVVFAEPGSTLTPFKTFWNSKKKGVWHNWLHSARTALRSGAELILTVQDDSLFHPESKEYVESILWPSPDTGFISLYTPLHYSFFGGETGYRVNSSQKREPVPADEIRELYPLKPPGIHKIWTQSLWGACALVWHRDVLQAVVQSETAKNWMGIPPPNSDLQGVLENRRNNPSLICNSDTAIGFAVQRLRRSMWFVDPSPVSHIAEHSATGHGDNTGYRNCHRAAWHSKPLRLQVPPPENLYPLEPPKMPFLTTFNIAPELIKKIQELIPPGSKILELGSGEGTRRLLELGYKVISIEDDEKWVGYTSEGRYIHAPLKDGWYDGGPLVENSEIIKDHDLLLVDGPRGSQARGGLHKHLWLLNPKAPVIVDDTHREVEMQLARSIASRQNRGIQTTICPSTKKWFTTLTERKE